MSNEQRDRIVNAVGNILTDQGGYAELKMATMGISEEEIEGNSLLETVRDGVSLVTTIAISAKRFYENIVKANR